MTERLLARDPLTDLRRAFSLFDDDHTGRISLKNLKRVARELGENLGEEELFVAIQYEEALTDTPAIPSFIHPLCSAIIGEWNALFSVRSACRQAMIDEFDLDQDGEINEAEFLAIMMDGE